jgi:hypothetical protein
MTHSPTVQVLKSTSNDAYIAVSEISQQICIKDVEAILFFCSSHYELKLLSKEINTHFDCLVIGCTTAGEISDQFYSNSMVALVLSSRVYAVHSSIIENVEKFNLSNAMKLATNAENNLKFNEHFSTKKMFGFLLTDGMSLKEENITSLLYKTMGDINIIGGSAGDDLEFKHTYIFSNHAFHSNAAVFLIIEVKNYFEIFRVQHFEPTDKELITTDVDFERRIVKEINGQLAADAYAEINGLDANNLTTLDFAMHPLMLNVSDKWYIRSISNVLPDKSLQFHCAIDAGLPLSIATGKDMIQKLTAEVEQIEQHFERIDFTLGCDCILRRIEMQNKGHKHEIEKLLSRINFIGFNSYGEQFNGLHFNQTLVGSVVGKKHHG